MAQISPTHFLLSKEELFNIADTFLQELEKSRDGEDSSLDFHTTNISKAKPKVTSVQVMAIGGSNFHSSVFKVEGGSVAQHKLKKKELPNFSSKEVLQQFILNNLEDSVDALALNFAYPLQAVQRVNITDGILLEAAKEHKFDGLIGKTIGEFLQSAIQNETGRQVKVSVANDTVCLVLSGLGFDKNDASLIGGIVGTGFNIGLFYDDSVVNLEAGKFSKFAVNPYTQIVDKASSEPQSKLLEKEIAGKYLFQTYNTFVEQNGRDFQLVSDTAELSDLAQKGDSQASEIASAIIVRSARLFAASIHASMRFLGKKRTTVVMEGSLYWSGFNYRKSVRQALTELDVDPLDVSFIHQDQSYLYGALNMFKLT
jgi:hexokinase